MKYEILNVQGDVVNVIVADPAFVEAQFPGMYRELPADPPPLPVVPQSVTMRQGRLALLGAGLLDTVDAALAAIPDEAQRRAAQIEWEYAQTIDRQSVWVANLSGALGLTDEQLDQLFVTAATL